MTRLRHPFHAGRREFLRRSAALSIAGGAAPLALNLATLGAAAAQSLPADYKALVCLFLFGGNDHANTVLATDADSWTKYTTVRTTVNTDSIALPLADLLPITPVTSQAGRSFALHPSLGPLKSLFDANRAAVIANVGPLIVPTSKLQYKQPRFPLPPKLFSHNDQSSTWQAYGPEGSVAGWGGRMGDLLAAANGKTEFTLISANGNSVYLAGRTIRQYQVSAAGAVPITNLTGPLFGASNNPLQAVVTGSRNNVFEKEHAAVTKRAIDLQSVLSTTMLPTGGVLAPTQYINPVTNVAATNPLATQFQTVARIIGGRAGLGAQRQVFFVSMGGFDTHDFQKNAHADLLARLAHALAYFDSALANLQGTDLRASVTTFTASDFGRSFTSNGDGTDHGWGSHHFITGGAVKGGDIYGAFPASGLGHDQDIGSGSLLPTISVDQYAATLGKWMGLSNAQLDDVFPNLKNFGARDLGFMT